jgi:hypothetical protein
MQMSNNTVIYSWATKGTEVYGGIFKHSLWIVTNLLLKYHIKIGMELTVSNFSL